MIFSVRWLELDGSFEIFPTGDSRGMGRTERLKSQAKIQRGADNQSHCGANPEEPRFNLHLYRRNGLEFSGFELDSRTLGNSGIYGSASSRISITGFTIVVVLPRSSSSVIV